MLQSPAIIMILQGVFRYTRFRYTHSKQPTAVAALLPTSSRCVYIYLEVDVIYICSHLTARALPLCITGKGLGFVSFVTKLKPSHLTE